MFAMFSNSKRKIENKIASLLIKVFDIYNSLDNNLLVNGCVINLRSFRHGGLKIDSVIAIIVLVSINATSDNTKDDHRHCCG